MRALLTYLFKGNGEYWAFFTICMLIFLLNMLVGSLYMTVTEVPPREVNHAAP